MATKRYTKKDLPEAQIRYLVGNMSVGTPDDEVVAEIDKRTKKWPEPVRKMAAEYALKVHHDNIRLYNEVMGGRGFSKGTGRAWGYSAGTSTDALRARIAKVLGWKVDDTNRFSLPTLAAFVRGKDKALDQDLAEHIAAGEHLFVKPKRRRR